MNAQLGAAEWDSTNDPLDIVNHLFPLGTDDTADHHTRTSRLYFIACARRAWERLPVCARELVFIAEQIIENEPLPDNLKETAHRLAEELVACKGEPEDLVEFEQRLRDAGRSFESVELRSYDAGEWNSLSHLVLYPYIAIRPNYRRVAPGDHCIEYLRDCYCNPHRDGRVGRDCLTSTVCALAREIYHTQDFSRLQVLADALEDAGCRNKHVLGHCRSPGPHIRGCWVLEGILHPPKFVTTRI